ncbi:MAG: phosphatidylserine decarboxylase [Candidatus Xenobiia bacterium LiM19]
MAAMNDRKKRLTRLIHRCLFAAGILLLLIVGLLLRFTAVTDYLYHAAVKDPDRKIPSGRVIVAPADGTVLYVKKITSGMVPEVVKQGVAVPVEEYLKMKPSRPFKDGWLIGIFMNTQGVHINRIPSDGVIKDEYIFNGPHMDMTETEREVIMASLIPGVISLRKLFGLPPFHLRNKSDYILKSARETMVIDEDRGTTLFVVRIADYYVGKILTWVKKGACVTRGEKMGMIAWGSQTDLFIESSPGLIIKADVGKYVYGGETVLATY